MKSIYIRAFLSAIVLFQFVAPSSLSGSPERVPTTRSHTFLRTTSAMGDFDE